MVTIDRYYFFLYNYFVANLFKLVQDNVWPTFFKIDDYPKVIDLIKKSLANDFEYQQGRYTITLDWFEEDYGGSYPTDSGYKLTIVYNFGTDLKLKFETIDGFKHQDVLIFLDSFDLISLQSK